MPRRHFTFRLRLTAFTYLRLVAAIVAVARIARGAVRDPPLAAHSVDPAEPLRPVDDPVGFHPSPRPTRSTSTSVSVSVVVPARDEAKRLGPCLEALAADPAVVDVLVVDDGSTDDTVAVARAHGAAVLAAGPPPEGWAGKTWALQRGFGAVAGDWVVALDADTRIRPGLIDAAVAAAERSRTDLFQLQRTGARLANSRRLSAPRRARKRYLSALARLRRAGRPGHRLAHPLGLLTVGGRFDCPSAGERFLHPAMLATLVYRFGPPGTRRPPRPGRALANGQCMVLERAPFLASGGFGPVSGSFTEDVALARHIASHGGTVRFVDGTSLLDIAGYGSASAVWIGWGRSLALAEVTPVIAQVADLAVIWAALAAPVPRLLFGRGDALDAALVVVRAGTLVALAGAYRRRGLAWWLSPLADVAVAAQLTFTTVRPVRTWRGRTSALDRRPRRRGSALGGRTRQPSQSGAR